MKYLSLLPRTELLIELARHTTFPATRDEVIRTALQKGYTASTIKFLHLFALYDLFENGIDFMNQCDELKLMIREERQTTRTFMHVAEC